MADGMLAREIDGACIERRLDGATLVFQRWADVWMIDRLPDLDDEGDPGASTAVTRDALEAADRVGLMALHDRQLRRLGLPRKGDGAAVLWRLVSEFDSFVP